MIDYQPTTTDENNPRYHQLFDKYMKELTKIGWPKPLAEQAAMKTAEEYCHRHTAPMTAQNMVHPLLAYYIGRNAGIAEEGERQEKLKKT